MAWFYLANKMIERYNHDTGIEIQIESENFSSFFSLNCFTFATTSSVECFMSEFAITKWKFGFSFILEKPLSPRRKTIENIVKNLKKINDSIIVVHGGGSFCNSSNY